MVLGGRLFLMSEVPARQGEGEARTAALSPQMQKVQLERGTFAKALLSQDDPAADSEFLTSSESQFGQCNN